MPGLDGRTATARRFRDLVNAFVADMGGLDRCSEIKLGLPPRLAAGDGCKPSSSRPGLVNGEQIDIGQLCALASTAVRIASRIGLERRGQARPADGQGLSRAR